MRWSKQKIGEVCIVNPRRPARLQQLPDSHLVSFVPMPAVDQWSGRIAGAETKSFGAVRKGFTYFADGDVIFAKITPCMQNGKSAIAKELANGLGFGSTEFHVIRPDLEKVLPEWIWYFVRQEAFRNEASHHFQGAVGQQRVPANFVEDTPIPIPPISEQLRIIARINECIERVEEIEKLHAEGAKEREAILPSLLSQAFDGLSGLPQEEIGDLSLETRYGTSRKCSTVAKGTPILRIPNVINGSVSFDNLKYCELDSKELRQLRLENGDLLFVRTNGSRELVGRCAIFTSPAGGREFGFASYLIRVRIDPRRILPEFVAYFLNSTHGRAELNKRRRTSAGQFNINSENLRNIKLPVPSLEVQKALIADFAEQAKEIRKLDSDSKEATDESSHLRDAILRKAFAGEL